MPRSQLTKRPLDISLKMPNETIRNFNYKHENALSHRNIIVNIVYYDGKQKGKGIWK